ncbi:MAG: hypothetical protein V4819_06730 [Verrucomicrobiota bacterium]
MKPTKTRSNLILIFLSAVLLSQAMGKEPAEDSPEAIEKRVQFLQKNFDRFQPVKFTKGQGTDSMMHLIPIKEAMFDYDGAHYCGFKFTVPQWADGDFKWMYLFAKNISNKDFSTDKFSWFIIPETGRCQGFTDFQQTTFPDKFPELKERYPYSRSLTVQSLDAARMIPGKTYGIWFRFEADDLPDIAFSMTIDSERGAREFGVLPLK